MAPIKEEIAEGLAVEKLAENRLSELQKITFREEDGSLLIDFTASGNGHPSGTLRLHPPKKPEPIQISEVNKRSAKNKPVVSPSFNDDADKRKIQVRLPITVREFAESTNLKPFKVISDLMELGIYSDFNSAMVESSVRSVGKKNGIVVEIVSPT